MLSNFVTKANEKTILNIYRFVHLFLGSWTVSFMIIKRNQIQFGNSIGGLGNMIQFPLSLLEFAIKRKHVDLFICGEVILV